MSHLVHTLLVDAKNGELFKYEIFLKSFETHHNITVGEGEGRIIESKFDKKSSVFKVTQADYDLQELYDKHRLPPNSITFGGGPVFLHTIIDYLRRIQ